jgi:malonyl-CoA decarboxylase
MLACVAGRGGEATAIAQATVLRNAYGELSRAGKRQFLDLIASELAADSENLVELAQAMLNASGNARLQAEEALRQALEPPWLQLLRCFNRLPDGTRFLVDLRADLLRFEGRDPTLVPLERELKRLLQMWFDVGFLELRRVTWDSSASLLGRLARSEAVHTVEGWDDLKNRLDVDRRFFAFFHPKLQDDPLIFVEVALTRGMPHEIRAVLGRRAERVHPTDADTAVFYSISNVERGLSGIPFGGFLIRQVVDELLRELPRLRNFATISPIPGFRAWLSNQPAATILHEHERKELEPIFTTFGVASLTDLLDEDWTSRSEAAAAARKPLMRLCATYLLTESEPGVGARGDPVLTFHLTNGARLDQISWLADRSVRGMAQSAGMMAHYVYELDQIESNHEAFTSTHELIASDSVKRLARGRRRRRRNPKAASNT